MAGSSAWSPRHPNPDRHLGTAGGGFQNLEQPLRPYWDVLGTWENAPLEVHELRYRERRRTYRVTSAEKLQRDLEELETAINIARVRRRHRPNDDSEAGV